MRASLRDKNTQVDALGQVPRRYDVREVDRVQSASSASRESTGIRSKSRLEAWIARQPVGLERVDVERDRLAREQVHRHRVAAVGIDDQVVEARRIALALARERDPPVALDDLDSCRAVRDEREVLARRAQIRITAGSISKKRNWSPAGRRPRACRRRARSRRPRSARRARAA